jgi:hypothetical protein
MDASSQAERGVGVAQVMEANARQAGLFDQTLKGLADDAGVKVAAIGPAED